MAISCVCGGKSRFFVTFLVRRSLHISRCLGSTETTGSGHDGGEHEGERTYTAEEIEVDVKSRILQSSLAHVHEFGWSQKALAAGAEMEGYPAIAHGMFPKGGVDLINYFYRVCTNEMVEKMRQEKEAMEKGEAERRSTPKFLRDSIEARLRMIVPYIDTWPEAMGTMALPQNAVDGWKNLAQLVDELWIQAGDKSYDLNWYTKRLSLAYIYKTTEISILTDQSPDFQDTMSFLDRRLEDVRKSSKCFTQVQNSGEFLAGVSKIAKNLLGLNRR
ncbi:ubiquinone biosynthesis protein COQ9, mitochondrial-like isoform X2 [Lineus longissimus]|uniref:ubiquinone biosynthesis protein COQ9, mitochondrial-like isoform X2 n=1 Tax=Lineus longissimus TaxID=88925 RepID=UPI002B4CD360